MKRNAIVVTIVTEEGVVLSLDNEFVVNVIQKV